MFFNTQALPQIGMGKSSFLRHNDLTYVKNIMWRFETRVLILLNKIWLLMDLTNSSLINF